MHGLAVTLLTEGDVVAIEMLARVFKMSIDELPEPVPRAIYDFVKGKSADRSEDVGSAIPELEVATAAAMISEEEENGEEDAIERSRNVEAKTRLRGETKAISSVATPQGSKTSNSNSEGEFDRKQDPVVIESLQMSTREQQQQSPVATGKTSTALPDASASVSAAAVAATADSSSKRKTDSRSAPPPPRSATHAWEEECYARWAVLL